MSDDIQMIIFFLNVKRNKEELRDKKLSVVQKIKKTEEDVKCQYKI